MAVLEKLLGGRKTTKNKAKHKAEFQAAAVRARVQAKVEGILDTWVVAGSQPGKQLDDAIQKKIDAVLAEKRGDVIGAMDDSDDSGDTGEKAAKFCELIQKS